MVRGSRRGLPHEGPELVLDLLRPPAPRTSSEEAAVAVVPKDGSEFGHDGSRFETRLRRSSPRRHSPSKTGVNALVAAPHHEGPELVGRLAAPALSSR